MSRPAFVCQRCNQCCTGEGGITLAEAEVPAAAAILGLAPDAFTARYCEAKAGRWSIRCGADGRCALLGPEGCLIHPAKPAICRAWPFFPGLIKDAGAFNEAKLICPGLDPAATHQDFLDQYQQELAAERQDQ
ncbi:MAG: YkgJ family cysteine cluster protein [Pseudomonadota bacterium]